MKRARTVLKNLVRSVTRISISPAKIDPSGLQAPLSLRACCRCSVFHLSRADFSSRKNARWAGDDVVIISARLWQRRFNSDPHIVGTKLLLDGKSFTVVGVMPAAFDFPLQLFNLGNGGQFGGRAEIWKPLAFTDDQMKARSSRSFFIVGRLAPGTSVAQAQAEIETINAQMRREHPDNYTQDKSFGGDVLPLQDLAVAGMRPALLILLGAVFLVLLIACANLTTMLLARAAAREREIAIRVALGAGRLRLLKQVFTESVLLALIGGVAGVLLALWGVELLKIIGAQTVPRLREVNVDLAVLGVTLAICVGTGIIFGLAPGLASARPELTEALKEGGRGSTQGTRRNRLRNGLVIAEVALALVLLSGAGPSHQKFRLPAKRESRFQPAQRADVRDFAAEDAISRRRVDRSF